MLCHQTSRRRGFCSPNNALKTLLFRPWLVPFFLVDVFALNVFISQEKGNDNISESKNCKGGGGFNVLHSGTAENKS